MIVAIHPDDYGPGDASSPVWSRLLREAGHEVREVDVRRADIIERLAGCHGFMWRHEHNPQDRQIARRLLPVVERELGLAVYPDQRSCWHYDDKIAQAYLLPAVGVPSPRSWVWFDAEAALDWVRTAELPAVLKLWSGAGGTNVHLVESREEARRWVGRLFGGGIPDGIIAPPTLGNRLSSALGIIRDGEPPPEWERHRGYALFQEFLPGNDFDTRVTVVGDRAFAFRRFNRENDFRASGSGRIDWDPGKVAEDFVRLAFDTARRLGTQSCAIDGLRRNGEAVVAEVSYTYASWAVAKCPGHWDTAMRWHEGTMAPEEAQIQDFLPRLAAATPRNVPRSL